jgi:hypothetical protein
MNRKEFFKKLGLGVLGIVVVPKVLSEIKDKSLEYPRGTLLHEDGTTLNKKELEDIYQKNVRILKQYYDQCSTPAPWEYDDNYTNLEKEKIYELNKHLYDEIFLVK